MIMTLLTKEPTSRFRKKSNGHLCNKSSDSHHVWLKCI